MSHEKYFDAVYGELVQTFHLLPRKILIRFLLSIGIVSALPVVAFSHDWNGIAIDGKGNLFVIDGETCEISKIAPDGRVSRLLAEAEDRKKLNHGHHIVLDKDGNLIIPSG